VSFLDSFAEDKGYCPSTFLVQLLDNNLNHVNKNGKEIGILKILNDGAGWRADVVNNIIKEHNETKATQKIDMTNIDVFEFPDVEQLNGNKTEYKNCFNIRICFNSIMNFKELKLRGNDIYNSLEDGGLFIAANVEGMDPALLDTLAAILRDDYKMHILSLDEEICNDTSGLRHYVLIARKGSGNEIATPSIPVTIPKVPAHYNCHQPLGNRGVVYCITLLNEKTEPPMGYHYYGSTCREGQSCEIVGLRRYRQHKAALETNTHKNRRMQELYNSGHKISFKIEKSFDKLAEQSCAGLALTTLTEEQEWLDRYFGEIECINSSKIACALSRDLCVKGGHASCRSQGWQHAMRNTDSFEDFLKTKNYDLLKTKLEENVVSIFKPGGLRNHRFTTVDLMHLSIHHSNSSEIIDDVENIIIQYYNEIVFPNVVKKLASKRSRDDSDSGDSDDSNNNRKKPKPSRKRPSSENDHGDDGQPKKKKMMGSPKRRR
jgi:hypothetical protein